MIIPFSKPFVSPSCASDVERTLQNSSTAGGGAQTEKSQQKLVDLGHGKSALLTNSATAALEMAAILCDLKPGDEVIMPSFTFVSTANAFVLRGAVPVFIDIESENFNIDPEKIKSAITSKTKAIVVVHYAGVACQMERITKLANDHGLLVVEDAAQGIGSSATMGKLGSIGSLGCLSFHSTKNLSSGEGGALLINDVSMIERAEIIWEKGTNRKSFRDGKVDKYTWVDVGSSFLPSEITATILLDQLNNLREINAYRKACWENYHEALGSSLKDTNIQLPSKSDFKNFNAHMFQMLLKSKNNRDEFIDEMGIQGITVAAHYVPLHSSPAGKRFGRTSGELRVTNEVSDRLVRLPMWSDTEMPQHYIIEHCVKSLEKLKNDR